MIRLFDEGQGWLSALSREELEKISVARFVEEDGYGDLIDWYVAKNPDTSLWHLLSVDIDGAWEWVGTKREVKKKFVEVLKNADLANSP